MDISSQSYKLLSLIAISGECNRQVCRLLSIPDSYSEKLITKLKGDGLIKIHYKDQLRGIRLTRRGKNLLLSQNSDRFSFYLTGNSETNRPRSELPRRLRLQQGSLTYALLQSAGILLYPDEKPLLTGTDRTGILLPVFYGAKEWKELGAETIKINNSRALGILLCEDALYVIYYTGDHLMKWEYRTELRLKAFLSYHLRQGMLQGIYPAKVDVPIKAFLLGNPQNTCTKLMESNGGYQKSYFYLDGSFDYVHFIPATKEGIALLKVFCDSTVKRTLDTLLLSDLEPVNPALTLIHDATKEGKPVLLSYDLDMLRISRFKTALSFLGITGHIICFDFQKDSLQSYFGNLATVETIDLAKFERRFLH